MIFDSVHLRNETCPKCRTLGKDRGGDNLGVFSDGHKRCWSCGYYEPGSYYITGKMQKALNKAKEGTETDGGSTTPTPILPFDSEPILSPEALFWLSSYGIDNQDTYKHKLLWSESKKLLIFPIFDKEFNLLMWQGRNFDKTRKGKWFTKGNPESILHIINENNINKHGIIIVEDLLSAIKVGHYASTSPLFGSNVSDERLLKLRLLNKPLTFWLDYDKMNYSYHIADKAMLLGMKAKVIVTKQDPKSYTNGEIESKLFRSSLSE